MRTLAVPALLALSLSTAACGAGRARYGQPAHVAERTTVAGTEVNDDAFANAVRDLLASEPGSRERQLRLQGVVSRQMSRVASRFKARDRERALASLAGAMYLVRAGELTSEMLGPQGYEALRASSEEFAKRGDEGRARATYEMLLRLAGPAQRPEIKAHLVAIAAWTRDTSGGGVMQLSGAVEAAAVTRHLLEPSQEARDEAVRATVDFVDKALAVRQARRTRGVQITRDEGLEAVRALETGTTVLAAIYLRNADAPGAVKAMDGANLREITRPELLRAVEGVVEHPESDRWLELARMLRPPPRQLRGDDGDFSRDEEMLRLASFVAACEAHRLDPTSPEPAAFVASTLVELGMGEAAPAVLADAVKAQKDPRVVGLGLALTMQAMGRELDAEEPDGVRRTFRAAAPVLSAAEALKVKVQPSPAKVYGLMGDIEVREGRLADARTLLEQSVEREKSGSILLSLARIDWHDGKTKRALDRLHEAMGVDDVQKDPALHGEVLLLESDVLRESGDASGARRPLAEALRDLAKARSASEGDDRARLERLIARVLDRFGASASAHKALDRALEAAPRDKRQAAATIGQMVGRALVKGDLAAAREGLSRGLAAELGREDLVYYAFWVRALERAQKVRGDGTAEHVLSQATDDSRWIGRVAAFGVGKLRADQLLAAAQTPSQRAEAVFYTALDKRAAGDTKGADKLLADVVASPGLDLMETALARDMLAGPRATVPGPVPEVGLP
jgi:tetratricopeptide (TPR) repeat protein